MKTVVRQGEKKDFMRKSGGKDLSGMDKTARIAYWQQQGSEAIIKAALETIGSYCLDNGIDLRIDRTVGFYSKNLADKK